MKLWVDDDGRSKATFVYKLCKSVLIDDDTVEDEVSLWIFDFDKE